MKNSEKILVRRKQTVNENVEKSIDVDENNYEENSIDYEKDTDVRNIIGRNKTIMFLIIPILLYIFVCTSNEILSINLEGITGGFFRVITGILAYTSFELLAVIMILNFYFRVIVVRLNPSKYKDDERYDFLAEYMNLEKWQRIKVDLYIFTLLLLLVLVNTIALLTRAPLTSITD